MTAPHTHPRIYGLFVCLCACAGDTELPAGTETSPWEGPLVLSDDTGFRYTANLDIASVPVAAGTDPWIDWADLTFDMLGHPLDPAADLTAAFVTVFGQLGQAELAAAIAVDDIPQSELSLFVRLDLEPGTTGAALSEFTMLGTDIDIEQYLEPDTGTWMVVLLTETDDAPVQYRKLLFVEPTVDDAPETVVFEDDDSLFDIDATLTGSTALQVPQGQTFGVDWSSLSLDGLDQALALHKIDRLTVGRYADHDVASLEAAFLDLDLLATEMWELDVEGQTEAELAELDGFSGVDADDTWLLALRCSTCSSPMPLFLGVLDALP